MTQYTAHNQVLDMRSPSAAAKRQNFPDTALFWDAYDANSFGIHFWQYVYEAMNDLLLNVLCDEQCEWALG